MKSQQDDNREVDAMVQKALEVDVPGDVADQLGRQLVGFEERLERDGDPSADGKTQDEDGRAKTGGRKGRGLWIGALAVAALAIMTVALERPAREWWHIYQLENGTESEKLGSLAKLVELESARAVPTILASFVASPLVPVQQVEMQMPALQGGFPQQAAQTTGQSARGGGQQWALPVQQVQQRLQMDGAMPAETISPYGVALANLGKPAARALVPILASSDSTDWATEEVLRRIGRDAVPALVKTLKQSNVKRRHRAINVLGQIREDSVAAVEPLIALLSGEIEDQRAAVNALANIGPVAKPAVSELVRVATESEDGQLRAATLYALGLVKSEPDLVLPVLIKALEASETYVRLSAVRAIGMYQEDASPTIRFLSDAIRRDKDFSVRYFGITALQQIGSVALQAESLLIEIGESETEDWRLRYAAAQALIKLGGKEIQLPSRGGGRGRRDPNMAPQRP